MSSVASGDENHVQNSNSVPVALAGFFPQMRPDFIHVFFICHPYWDYLLNCKTVFFHTVNEFIFKATYRSFVFYKD